jgi:hypothetical protein
MNEDPDQSSRFADKIKYWDAFDFGARDGITGDENSGRMGMVHDGQFLYFMPGQSNGNMGRYNTAFALGDAKAWETVNVENMFPDITSGGAKGYANGVFDGRYVYYAPYFDGDNYHGRAIRYDAQGTFASASSWEAVDIKDFFPALGEARGYNGAVFDGRYVYYMPYHQKPMFCLGYHGKTVRYDTQAPFASASSWQAIDFENIFAPGVGHATGYVTGVYDGRYVYYVPYFNSSGYHGKAVRYDTHSKFESPSSWQATDISDIFGDVPGTKGYNGATFDGRYVYYAPYNDGKMPMDMYHGKMVRFDTRGEFTAHASWEATDLGSAFADRGISNTQGYQGAAFDGRYVYYAPWYDGREFHGRVLRFDTQQAFREHSSWEAVDITGGVSSVNPLRGFDGAVFDGKKYVYFNSRCWGPVPGKVGKVARYDAVG